MIDPATAKTPTYADDVNTAYSGLKSDQGRMVLVAARGAKSDVAAAAVGAIAGYDPQVSTVLKRLRGVAIDNADLYTPTEITQLSNKNIIPVVSPALLGGGFYFGEGRTYTDDATLQFVDAIRVLDDIDFRLKAGLIGAIGDARITKMGLRQVATRLDGILQPLQSRQMIDGYSYSIPVLDILSTPENSWTPGQSNTVQVVRGSRAVPVYVFVKYGPAVHRLDITLIPSFV